MTAKKRPTPKRHEEPYGEDELHELQRNTFRYFWEETSPENGLIPDNTSADDLPASIAGVGLALSSYPVAVERSFVTRAEAAKRTLATLRFLWNAPQGEAPDATGHRGFFYHFLDIKTGRRAWECELSTIDTAVLIAGALTAAAYFNKPIADEHEVRELADSLYRRVDWRWAQNRKATVSHGWTPESGFEPHQWEGYNEALILYVLGLGSPTHPLSGQATRRGPPPIAGRHSTVTSSCTALRCSCTSCPTSGLISAASRTPSCARRQSTTSRTAGEPHT